MAGILVVDHEKVVVNNLCRVLSHKGFYAIGTTCPDQGLDYFLRDKHVGVIISHLGLRTQDGSYFLDKVRSDNDRGAECELVLAIEPGDISNLLDCTKFRIKKCITKPIVNSILLNAVEAAISSYWATSHALVASPLADVNSVGLFTVAAHDPTDRSHPARFPNLDRSSLLARRRMMALKKLLEFRETRASHLPQEMFGDPAWLMLVELAFIERQGKLVSVSGLSINSRVSQTTALRRIQEMVDTGLIFRSVDPDDGRRSYLTVAGDANKRLDQVLDQVIAMAQGICDVQ